MNVDWKLVCQSPGYKSLKKAYIADAAQARKDIKKHGWTMRTPAELYAKFQKALLRVWRIAQRKGIPFTDALDTAEEKRGYWWLNFYSIANLEYELKSPYPSLYKPWSKETIAKRKRAHIRKLTTRKRKRNP